MENKYYSSGEILPRLLADTWANLNGLECGSSEALIFECEMRRFIDAGIAAGIIRKLQGLSFSPCNKNALFEDCNFEWEEVRAWAATHLKEEWPAIPPWVEAQAEVPAPMATLFVDSSKSHIPVGDIAAMTARALQPDDMISRAAALKYHEQQLDEWLRRGDINGYEPATGRVLKEQLSRLPIPGSPLSNASIPINDARKFAASVGVRITNNFSEVSFQFSTALRNEIISRQHWEERELEALCLGVPPALYADGCVPQNEMEKIRTSILNSIQKGELDASSTNTGNPVYGGMWKIERISAQRWAITSGFTRYPEWLSDHDLKEVFADQDKKRRAAGRFTLNEAAAELAETSNIDQSRWLSLIREHVKSGKLSLKNPRNTSDQLPYPVPNVIRDYYDEVDKKDVNTWLDLNTEWGSHRLAEDIPVPIASLPNVIPGITKQEAVAAFQGLHFDAEKWNKYLASPPKWLEDCRTRRGGKSVLKHPSLWDPVLIAAALIDKNISIKKLDIVFVAHKSLLLWREKWTEKSSYFR